MPSEGQQVREEVNGLKHILRDRQAELAGRGGLDTMQGTFQSIRTQEGRALSFASGWPHSHYVCLQVWYLSEVCSAHASAGLSVRFSDA